MEVWKPIRNFPSYNASNKGRIMNIRTQRIMKTFVNSKGYETVCLRKNNRQYTVRVHKIIAETFLGEHPGMDIRHKNYKRSDNDVSNLEWCTRSKVISDSYERGDRKPSRQIPVKVLETGKEYNSIRACARDIRCAQTEISRYFSGKRSHVKGYHFDRI